MSKLLRKLFIFTSVIGAVGIIAGCSTSSEKSYDTKYYQTHEDADVTKVSAKMYTHSSSGGESSMGHIKFQETDSGLKMSVDLQDLRPGVKYNIHVYDMKGMKKDMKKMSESEKKNWMSKNEMSLNLPTLKAGESGKLEETFIVRGITAADLNMTKIVLERDGNPKAAWGRLEKTMW